MGCLDHVRGHGDQVHVTGQTEEGWSWRRWGNWPLLQQQQVTACLWPVAKCRGGLGLIQLNKQNTLPIWLFIFHQHKFNQSIFYFLRRGSYSSSFLAFSGFFFSFPPPNPSHILAPSRRGDLEILGYCMLQWLCGKLPWEQNLKDPVAVQTAKTR